jgi:hypothetical protein
LYHDDVGGNGDFFSGVYTGPDGRVQTGTSVATASLARSTSQGSRTTAAGLATSAAGQATSAGAASASTGSAKAAASSGAAIYLGANVGLMGLVAGLIV